MKGKGPRLDHLQNKAVMWRLRFGGYAMELLQTTDPSPLGKRETHKHL